jgi:hypothetical protein
MKVYPLPFFVTFAATAAPAPAASAVAIMVPFIVVSPFG